MSLADKEHPQESALERHTQTILAGLILAGIVGLVSLVFSVYGDIKKSSDEASKANTAVQVHLTQIDERIVVLQSQISQTYRADEARRDTAETTRQIDDIKRRLTALEANTSGRSQPRELQQWRKN